jgi:hypothetical protein
MDDSLLIRSAESLGRMIGALQRQLDGASKKSNEASGFTGVFGVDERNDGSRGGGTTDRAVKNSGPKASRSKAANKGGSRSGATKVRSTSDRKSKRAAKSAGAKKSGASARKSTKRSRG